VIQHFLNGDKNMGRIKLVQMLGFLGFMLSAGIQATDFSPKGTVKVRIDAQDRTLAKPLFTTFVQRHGNTPAKTGYSFAKGGWDYGTTERTVSIVQVSQQNNRPYQEDRVVVIQKDNIIGVGLFDGHGGSAVSEQLSADDGIIAESIAEIENHNCKSETVTGCDQIHDLSFLKKTFTDFNATHFKNVKAGSTAVCAFLLPREMFVVNTGDSRAVGADGYAITTDHKPSDPTERARIEKAGGFVAESFGRGPDRVGGILAVSRAFGDTTVQGITAEPDIFQLVGDTEGLSPDYPVWMSRQHPFIILASDGLWDFLPNKIKHYTPAASKQYEMMTRVDKMAEFQAKARNRVAAHIVNSIFNEKGFGKEGFEHAALALMLATIQKEAFSVQLCKALTKEQLLKLVHDGGKTVNDNQAITIVGWQEAQKLKNEVVSSSHAGRMRFGATL
jgi:serine/threonine protein phosphatase PrpC